MKHVRETTTPIGDELIADCSCGETYSVPQGGDEYAALEAAHERHTAGLAQATTESAED